MAFLTNDQLQQIGFRSLGAGVLISEKCSIYRAEHIEVGDRTRIDDFCILSAGEGGIRIGNNVHIACYSSLIGAGPILIEDFANVSSRVAIYSSNDDYSGLFLTNPTVPAEYTHVTHGPVIIERHVIVGAGSVILPNVRIGVGAAVGALSLVTQDCEPFALYAGIPARFIKTRPQNALELAKTYLATIEATAGQNREA
jgi:galactoside O-acetyltransferase